jgi:hypothetical protein
MWATIRASQEEVRAAINVIQYAHAEFEEPIIRWVRYKRQRCW